MDVDARVDDVQPTVAAVKSGVCRLCGSWRPRAGAGGCAVSHVVAVVVVVVVASRVPLAGEL